MKSLTSITSKSYLVSDTKYYKQLGLIAILFLLPLAIILAVIISHASQPATTSSDASSSTSSASGDSPNPATTQPSQPPTESPAPQPDTPSPSTVPSELRNASMSTATQYKVTKVIDGDTIKVSGLDSNIRLIGINTPETVHPNKPVECFGPQASDYLKTLLAGQYVALEYDTIVGDTDTYHRYLRYVYLGTENINYKMLYNGYAHEASYGNNYKYSTDFVKAEKDASSASRGLWSPATCNGNL